MFWKKDFPLLQHISILVEGGLQSSHGNSEREELRMKLQQAHATIDAIKSSKFWKMQTALFQSRKMLRIPTKEQLL